MMCLQEIPRPPPSVETAPQASFAWRTQPSPISIPAQLAHTTTKRMWRRRRIAGHASLATTATAVDWQLQWMNATLASFAVVEQPLGTLCPHRRVVVSVRKASTVQREPNPPSLVQLVSSAMLLATPSWRSVVLAILGCGAMVLVASSLAIRATSASTSPPPRLRQRRHKDSLVPLEPTVPNSRARCWSACLEHGTRSPPRENASLVLGVNTVTSVALSRCCPVPQGTTAHRGL